MNTKSTLERLIELVAEQLDIDQSEIKPESHFARDLGGDSLDHIEIIMAIEEDFYIEIPDVEVEKCLTVADCVALVDAKVAAL